MSENIRAAAIRRRHALLGARARRLARSRKPLSPVLSISCLLCASGDSLYGVPLRNVVRVAAFRSAAFAPTRNPALLGALARSAAVYHVYDLARLLGAETPDDGGHVVFLRGGPPAIALRVSAALRVLDLVEIDAGPTSRMAGAHPAIKSYVGPTSAELLPEELRGRTILLLDPNQLAPRDKPANEGAARVDQ